MRKALELHTLEVLDFGKLTALLARFAVSEIGEHFCANLAPQTDPARIRERLQEVSEMKHLLSTHSPLPLEGLKHITPLLSKAAPEGACLAPRELWDILILIRCSRATRDSFPEDAPYPAVSTLVKKLSPLSALAVQLTKAVDAAGEVLDSASRELERIRRTVRSSRLQIKDLLEGIMADPHQGAAFQEKLITIRNDRYVVPVKAESKKRVPGVVHDQSHHQATYFIEPFPVVELNNQLTLLREEEKAEEFRILRALTDRVREAREALQENQRLLGILDCIQARALMSEAMGAREPHLADLGGVLLLQARHPLLLLRPAATDQDPRAPAFDNPSVVPIDIRFPSPLSTLVISGANMGGKTAAIKTLGLLTLMTQAGMHIPVAEGSTVALWEKVFADIGDEQDLEARVSTFSSHLVQLKHILEGADARSLVLIDEVGAGTDPQEGAALTLAILDRLRAKKAKTAVTSHLGLLKAYAASHDDVLNVSVLFDAATLKPVFKLLYGVPGTSKALETAERLGLDLELVRQAKVYLQEHDRRVLALSDHLELALERIETLRGDFSQTLASATRYEETVQSLAEKIAQRKSALFAETEKKARNLVRETEAELKRLMKNASTLSTSRVKSLRQEVQGVKARIAAQAACGPTAPSPLPELKKGARIRLGKGGKQVGEIVEVDLASRRVEIQVEGMRVKAGFQELAQLKGMPDDRLPPLLPEAAPVAQRVSADTEPLNTITLIGLRAHEALPLVDKAIDQALVYHQKELRIIHGLGTGRLRQAIHQHLRTHLGIRHFRIGDVREGGAGITIVEFEG